MPELESSLEAFFRKRVRLVGGYAIKLAPTERGVPDRLVLLPGGRMYLVELKTETGQLSPVQKILHERIAEQTHIEVVVLYGRTQIISWLRRQVSALGPSSKTGRRSAASVG